jgi:hypothetical protein
MRIARSLLLALLLPSVAFAAPAAAPAPVKGAIAPAIDAAVALLSRYPAGMVPVDPGVMAAILLLGEQGSRDEVSLLRNLVENERDEIRDAAARAIADIRGRQRQSQRAEYAETLPGLPALEEAAQPFLDRGLGHHEALCAAYASFVLGGLETITTSGSGSGDPERLLAAGRPHKALSAAMQEDSKQSRLLAARAREDLGDVAGAVKSYAMLAAGGDADARQALDGFGVDAERLLLGMLSGRPAEGHGEAEVLEVLVRHGGALTVSVLSERLDSPVASDRATATDALARMLDPDVRGDTLPMSAQRDARQALAAASQQGPEPVRELASEALKAVASETAAP